MLTIDDQGTIDALVRDLRTYPAKRAVVKALRSELRAPLPAARAAVRARAVATLPARGGLGRWVAASRIGASVRVGSTTIRLTVRAGRNSRGGRSDIRAIDRGRVRAKAWGRPQWHQQTVPAGFFTGTLVDDFGPVWEHAAVEAAQHAAEVICRGGQ